MNKQQVILTTKDNFKLAAVINAKPGDKKIVILAHGITSSMEHETINIEAAKRLNSIGISTCLFDFRCHGKSSGDSVKDFSITGEIIDLETVIMYLKEQGYIKIGLAAASFAGGTAAIYVGIHEMEIAALCLINPALNYTNIFLNPTTEWSRRHFADAEERIEKDGYISVGSRQFHIGKTLFDDLKEYEPCESLQKYNHPLLIIHGDKDTTVSHEDTYACFMNLPNEKKELEIIHGAEHGFHDDPYTTEVAQLITDFFQTSAA